MSEGTDGLRRRLHEALDAVDRRDDQLARLRADLEATGRRLAAQVVRRREAEERLARVERELGELVALLEAAEAEADALDAPPEEPVATPEATSVELVREAGSTLGRAGVLVLRAVWHLVPAPVRERAWEARWRLRDLLAE